MRVVSKLGAMLACASLVTVAACTTDPETGQRTISKTAIGGIGGALLFALLAIRDDAIPIERQGEPARGQRLARDR